MTTETPRDLRSLPMAAVVMPLPTELTTPPLTNMYLVAICPLAGGLLSPRVMISDAPPQAQDCGGQTTAKKPNSLSSSCPHKGSARKAQRRPVGGPARATSK